MQNPVPDSLYVMTTQALANVAVYLPRIFAALLILIIGTALAKAVKKVVVRIFESLRVSDALKQTPLEHFLKNADVTHRIEEVLGNIVYWLAMLVVLHTTVSVLGLVSLTMLLERVLAYIPNVLAAVIVLFFGVLLAGVVESLVKGSIKSIDGKSARLIGKISSYLVVSVAVLAAISELGIAKDFVTILFVGFVTTISLGFGLALGLGGQHVIKDLLGEWYQRTKAEIKE